MATSRGSRLPIGSASWILEERSAALQITESEVEEFSYSVRNDFEWLNEHMAGILDENEINVAEMFKTPGKLRGKTPKTARRQITEARVPLSDIFSGTPHGNPNPFLQKIKRIVSPAPNTGGLNKPSPALGFSPKLIPQSPKRHTPVPPADSGYHGSQSQDADAASPDYTQHEMNSPTPAREYTPFRGTPAGRVYQSPTKTRVLQSPTTTTFTTAKEEQTVRIMPDATQQLLSPQVARTRDMMAQPSTSPSPAQAPGSPSPKKSSPLKTSPVRLSPVRQQQQQQQQQQQPQSPIRKLVPAPVQSEEKESESHDEEKTHSDGSSPIRPLVRKSSLNFASLPAREPLNTGKSLGGRMSRTSHLDPNRTSYYGRTTGGKSLGNAANAASSDDEMDIDDEETQKQAETEDVAAHNKSYTRRLQDQISMLSKSQPRPSKSIPNLVPATPARAPQAVESKASSPVRKPTTPGAFPEDDDDEWIEPPATTQPVPRASSPRPIVPPKDHPLDAEMSGTTEFVLPKQRPQTSRPASPQKQPTIPERTTSALGHMKSVSVSALPDSRQREDMGAVSPKKTISVSNPTLATVSKTSRPETPKSPTRSIRESPLKHVKNKLSSILKSSKGLLASSAALSAESKSSILSPSSSRLGDFGNPSSETMAQCEPIAESVYPDLTQALIDAQTSRPASPVKPVARRTRASAERERREKQQEKEVRAMESQMDKLEKARVKEAEKARIFSKEQERIASMEKQVVAQKEQDARRPATTKGAPRPPRMSPRKPVRGQADGDTEMQDATVTMPPPPPPTSISRPTPSGPGSAMRNKDFKRPMRPTKETSARSRAAPTVIKVNMGPHHSQYHPSNNALSANLHEALGPAGSSQAHGGGKSSLANLKSKGSLQSLKSVASSAGRPKALELAAKRKEQEEREAQRKRDARAETERKRAAIQEEERRQEQQRRLEAEKQNEREREMVEAKKAAQRQAIIDRAKQTRAPPPAVRSQPNGPPDYSAASSKETAGARGGAASRPPSRMGSALFRSQDDLGRPVNALLTSAAKGQKRPLGPDNDGGNARAQAARGGPAYQSKDAKRRRTSQEQDEDMESLPNIKGPPVRPSAGYKKDLPGKAMYAGGYTAGPQSGTRDLFKTTVTSQHSSAIKTSVLDTTQFSKGAIPFAVNGGGQQQQQQAYKTPGRPGVAPSAVGKSTAKSATRTSPRFQNGDSIELPEIRTDDEDDDDSDQEHGMMASWADSPDLRRALLRQETMDPAAVFGPSAPLNMEEVFAKSKDRWHKFRARTSSANWSGGDRLTEEDIRRDMAARDKLRREGAWTYEMSKDL